MHNIDAVIQIFYIFADDYWSKYRITNNLTEKPITEKTDAWWGESVAFIKIIKKLYFRLFVRRCDGTACEARRIPFSEYCWFIKLLTKTKAKYEKTITYVGLGLAW